MIEDQVVRHSKRFIGEGWEKGDSQGKERKAQKGARQKRVLGTRP